MSTRPPRPRIHAAAVVAAVVALAAPTPAARANTYTIASCSPAQPTPAPWFAERTITWMNTWNDCRPTTGNDGMEVYPLAVPVGGLGFGQWSHWKLVVPGSQRI